MDLICQSYQIRRESHTLHQDEASTATAILVYIFTQNDRNVKRNALLWKHVVVLNIGNKFLYRQVFIMFVSSIKRDLRVKSNQSRFLFTWCSC